MHEVVWLGVDLTPSELGEMLQTVRDALALGAALEVVKKGYGAQGDVYVPCTRCGSDGEPVYSGGRRRCQDCGWYADDWDMFGGLCMDEVDDELAFAEPDDVYQVWDDEGAYAIVVEYDDDGRPVGYRRFLGGEEA